MNNSKREVVRFAKLGLAVGIALAVSQVVADHGSFPTTQGIYRIPFFDGLTLGVGSDHHDHGGPMGNKNRMDMSGDLANGAIVAAAGGWIRGIVDIHGNSNGNGNGVDINGSPQDDDLEHSCTDNDTVAGQCTNYNNYVWIEHPNGEWSKYSHTATGSVSGNGWAIGDWINAGEVLGPESDIGFATGPHLHHEMAIPSDPTDPTPFSMSGGFIQGTNIVPIVCDIANNLYVTGGDYTAAPCMNQLPVADAGGPYQVDEGSLLVLDGSNSFDPDGTPLIYLWTPAGNLDDPSLAQPIFTAIDDAQDLDYVLTVFDQTEAWPDMDMTTVDVLNVAPTVTAIGDSIDEAGNATVSASVFDPGTADTHTATIDWGDGGALEAVTIAQLNAGRSHQYGDNGSYTVMVEVTDDDGGIGSDSAIVSVANLDPALTLDVGMEIAFPGGNYQVVAAGQSLPVSADGSDPGSDDLTFSWSTGDVGTHFNNGVSPDPVKSPFGTFPFDATDSGSFLQATPGVTTLAVTLSDDDGGEDDADSGVIVTGNATSTEGSGWWKHQYSGNGSSHIDAATTDAYRQIVNAVSGIFSESTVANSAIEVHQILSPQGGDRFARARADLMLSWLSFASGAVAHDAMVPLQSGAVVFLDLMFSAEAILLNPGSDNKTLQQLEKDLAKVRFAN